MEETRLRSSPPGKDGLTGPPDLEQLGEKGCTGHSRGRGLPSFQTKAPKLTEQGQSQEGSRGTELVPSAPSLSGSSPTTAPEKDGNRYGYRQGHRGQCRSRGPQGHRRSSGLPRGLSQAVSSAPAAPVLTSRGLAWGHTAPWMDARLLDSDTLVLVLSGIQSLGLPSSDHTSEMTRCQSPRGPDPQPALALPACSAQGLIGGRTRLRAWGSMPHPRRWADGRIPCPVWRPRRSCHSAPCCRVDGSGWGQAEDGHHFGAWGGLRKSLHPPFAGRSSHLCLQRPRE